MKNATTRKSEVVKFILFFCDRAVARWMLQQLRQALVQYFQANVFRSSLPQLAAFLAQQVDRSHRVRALCSPCSDPRRKMPARIFQRAFEVRSRPDGYVYWK